MPRPFLFAIAICLAGCAQRGEITLSSADPDIGTPRTVFTATNRNETTGPDRFGTERASGMSFRKYDISIPPVRTAGTIPWPRRDGADPERHFVTRAETNFDDAGAFRKALAVELSAKPRGERNVTIFVHGFNNTFAEGVYRMAQMSHDLDLSGVAVHFAWPSAANALGYVYDRDSAIYSRDALEDLVAQVSDAGAERILILAHSMGSLLTMEALREISVSAQDRLLDRISGVILMSPDIDIDVFRAQARAIGPLPQPFVIFVSRRDRALALSARLTGQRERLGNIATPEAVAEFNVTVVDISAFSGGGGLNHFAVGNSPELIRLLNRLPEVDNAFQTGRSARPGLLPGTILTVQNATEVILSPLTRIAN
jgi:esterase/lipase superfamily enzyme